MSETSTLRTDVQLSRDQEMNAFVVPNRNGFHEPPEDGILGPMPRTAIDRSELRNYYVTQRVTFGQGAAVLGYIMRGLHRLEKRLMELEGKDSTPAGERLASLTESVAVLEDAILALNDGKVLKELIAEADKLTKAAANQRKNKAQNKAETAKVIAQIKE